MNINLIHAPDAKEWAECLDRARITMYGKELSGKEPSSAWKHKILEARHSPIRVLRYSFLLKGIPSNTATHLCRHIHAQPYVSSLRNDRQDAMDGDSAPRNTPVDMILDVNAEELMVIANKRLCMQSAQATRDTVSWMCHLAIKATPELDGLLVPMCVYQGGICHEMKPCGKARKE